MQPLRLYIEDFMCYNHGYIDFSQFSTALILGKIENNELYSNGVGKTTIFKAIEYVLFNQSDANLDRIIRDDINQCRIVFDFEVDGNEYRLSRTRTKKGSTDLTLLQRNAQAGTETEIFHEINGDRYIPIIDAKSKYWKDISGRRTSDTERDLAKLIKCNYKSFRSTIHFIQNDLSGLATATPEKRKGI